MSKKHSQRHKVSSRVRQDRDTLRIVWMLTVVTAAACEVASLVASQLPRFTNVSSDAANLLAGLLFFASLVIGVIALALTLAVYRQPKDAPPRAIGVFAIVVGLAPVFLMFFRAAG